MQECQNGQGLNNQSMHDFIIHVIIFSACNTPFRTEMRVRVHLENLCWPVSLTDRAVSRVIAFNENCQIATYYRRGIAVNFWEQRKAFNSKKIYKKNVFYMK